MKKSVIFAILTFAATNIKGMTTENINQCVIRNVNTYKVNLVKDANKKNMDVATLLREYQNDLNSKRKFSDKKNTELGEIYGKIEQELTEIRNIVFYISLFIQKDLGISRKGAAKALRDLGEKLKTWGEVDSPILSRRRTVQQVAETYGWGSVARQLLENIKTNRTDNNRDKEMFRMLLKAKLNLKKDNSSNMIIKKKKSVANLDEKIVSLGEIEPTIPENMISLLIDKCSSKLTEHFEDIAVKEEDGSVSVSVNSCDTVDQLKDYIGGQLLNYVDKQLQKIFKGQLPDQISRQLQERLGKEFRKEDIEQLQERLEKEVQDRVIQSAEQQILTKLLDKINFKT